MLAVLMERWPLDSPLPSPPALGRMDVHIWCASLERPPLPHAHLRESLTVSERTRAEHHVSRVDQVQSAASRGLLRWLLAGYLGMEPRDVPLRFGPQGKPELSADQSPSDLRFNVSQSDGLAVYGLTYQRDIGIMWSVSGRC